MKYMRVWAIALGMCLGISIVCGANNSIEVKKVAPNSPESKPLVLVSVPPLVQIVRAIAGDSVEVQSIVPAEVSPETYEPKPAQAHLFTKALAFVGVGMEYEHVLQERLGARLWEASLESSHAHPPKSTTKSTSKTPKSTTMIYYNLAASQALKPLLTNTAQKTHRESTTPHLDSQVDSHTSTLTHSHEHENHDPHIWLSLDFATINAREIYALLCAILPAHKPLYTRNLAEFLARIESLQQEFASMLASKKGGAFLVIHPAFGYLAREFELEEIALEENGKELGLKALSQLHERLEQKQVRTLFVQPQFDKGRARALADILGLEMDILDPLQEDWEGIMRAFLHKIAKSTPNNN